MSIFEWGTNVIYCLTYLIPRLLAQTRHNTCYQVGSKIEVGDLSSQGAHTFECDLRQFALGCM